MKEKPICLKESDFKTFTFWNCAVEILHYIWIFVRKSVRYLRKSFVCLINLITTTSKWQLKQWNAFQASRFRTVIKSEEGNCKIVRKGFFNSCMYLNGFHFIKRFHILSGSNRKFPVLTSILRQNVKTPRCYRVRLRARKQTEVEICFRFLLILTRVINFWLIYNFVRRVINTFPKNG